MPVTNQETDNVAKWERDTGVEARLLDRYRTKLLQQIEPLTPERVLDVGCGEGLLTGWLSERLPGATVEGFEGRAEAVEEFRVRNPGLAVHQGDLYALPFADGEFDLVVALEVLDHLEDPAAALRELHRVSSRAVVVTVPLEPAFRLGSLARRRSTSPGPRSSWTPLGFRRLVATVVPGGHWFEALPWQGYVSVRPDGGQEALEEHFERWVDASEHDFRAASLNRLVASMLEPGRTLDVGCGTGGLTAILLRQGHDVVAQDASPAIVELCRRYLERNGLQARAVRTGLIEDIDPDERYDSIVALDVIEHIEDDVAAVAAMRDVLAPGGRLVLSVPAMSSLYGPKDVAIGHYRRYDRGPLVELLERQGFRVASVRYWNLVGVPAVWFTSRVLSRRVDESFRYGDRSRAQRLLNDALRAWFEGVEARLRPPFGLSLIVDARRD